VVSGDPCYGRDEELGRILAAYEAASAGAARVVTVLGEAGIGKTRLLQELAVSARRRGALVVWGRCLEGAWVPPYQALVEAISGYAGQVGAARLRADLGPAVGPLGQLVPGLREVLSDVPTPEPLQPDEERLRLLDAVARFLARLSTHGPVVLVLDDLQWADASTLVTLRHLARVLVGHRLLLVAGYRTGEVGPELVDVLGALRSEAEVTAVALSGPAADALGACWAGWPTRRCRTRSPTRSSGRRTGTRSSPARCSATCRRHPGGGRGRRPHPRGGHRRRRAVVRPRGSEPTRRSRSTAEDLTSPAGSPGKPAEVE
jgi:AAA ATPase domain